MWSLREGEKNFEPLVFSNGKNQEDIVKEVVESIKRGSKIILIRGVCGTGKSAIALNIANELGRASIVVPVKSLQKQYEDDYTNRKYLLKKNGEKLRIKVLTGRANHQCLFISEDKPEFYRSAKKEGNAKISDFEFMLNRLIEKNHVSTKTKEKYGLSCDNPLLPCRIDIKEKNFGTIKSYLDRNPKINPSYFNSVRKVRRMSIAPVCPYWSPIIPSEIEVNLEAKYRKYKGLAGKEYKIYQRKQGCSYYGQFNSYIDADAIIFNSQKYKIETAMNRKPETEVEIIDECDEFLDSFSNEKKINLNRLNVAIGSLFSENEKTYKLIEELAEIIMGIIDDEKLAGCRTKEITPLKETKVLGLLRHFLDTDIMAEVECDEENYCYHCDEVARTFEDFLDESYVSFESNDNETTAKIVTINLKKRFKEMLDKNKAIVMMSGTLHSEKVLKDIFGIENYKVIEAETETPGTITPLRTGYEAYCSFKNFQSGIVTREKYLQSFEACINYAKKPVLIHIVSFTDLPTKEEAERYNLSIMTQEEMKEMQIKGRAEKMIIEFKEGKRDILFTTKCNRGIDFPGEMCNSIILSKYPYPNISSIFWTILRQTKPLYYSEFYTDKAQREFLQRVYRGVRSKEDHIFLLSPDIRVFRTRL
ncbi:DEAD/DEAH box helicase family protein [Candidatus Pacearchaeota archaeon]|nr:DEAD/DEAH box helicase family protein [Candidatus Pacearchaeota archaeon]